MRNKNARVPDPNKFVSCPGDKFHIEYRPVVNDDGTIKLVESGKMNIQEYIQSFKDSCDMNYIIKQLQLGNISVLNQKKVFYGDFTDAPSTMAEFQQRIIDGQNAFYSLPLEVRNKYDHDVMKFLADIGSDKWMNAMKDFIPVKDNIDVEVKEDA